MKKLKLALALALLGCLAIFLLQNLSTVSVKFLVWKADLSVAIPILASFFIGGFAARPLFRFLNGQRREHKRDNKAAKTAAKEASNPAAVDPAKVIADALAAKANKAD